MLASQSVTRYQVTSDTGKKSPNPCTAPIPLPPAAGDLDWNCRKKIKKNSQFGTIRQISVEVAVNINNTVDGSEIRRSPVEVGSLSHYLQGFIHPMWCRISSIDSINVNRV